MFLTKTAQTPAFAPRDYSAPDTFESELRHVFARSWNVVAAEGELATHGTQLALDVGGVPVLVRNEHGQLHAFRNVCPHRHSLVAPPGQSCTERLRCQYHGWEFAADGKLCGLPDGRSFVGWKAKGTGLAPLRCERAFGLVFVNVAPGSTSLREDWPVIYDTLRPHFEGMALQWIQLTEHDVNWKVVVENAVESYHVPLIHPHTFGNYNDERWHGHVVEPVFTQYHDLKFKTPLKWQLLDGALFRESRLHGYSHTHVFPNHLITWAGFYREWVVVVPLGPTRCRRIGYGFFPDPARAKVPGASLLVSQMARRTRMSADRILGEDSSVWPSVQRGSEASSFQGVLSVREERVSAFQRWVMERRAEP